jgi:hypothetical protein
VSILNFSHHTVKTVFFHPSNFQKQFVRPPGSYRVLKFLSVILRHKG